MNIADDLRMRGCNFEIWQSGGGCTAWRKDFRDGGYVLVTDSSGSSHELDAGCIVGVYDSGDNEAVCATELPSPPVSHRELVAALRALTNMRRLPGPGGQLDQGEIFRDEHAAMDAARAILAKVDA